MTAPVLLSAAAGANVLPASASQEVRIAEPVTVKVWNRPIVTLRAALDELDPPRRAESVVERIRALSHEDLGHEVSVRSVVFGPAEGLMISVGPYPIVGIVPEDLDPEGGETLEQMAQETARRLTELLRAQAEQRKGAVLLRGIGLSLGATLLFALWAWGIARARRFALKRFSRTASPLPVAGFDVAPAITTVERIAVKLGVLGAWAVAGYLWLSFVLLQFPISAPLGEHLGTFLRSMSVGLGTSAFAALPGLFAVLVIFLFTRLVGRAITGLFRGVERGQIALAWLEPETANATRRLIIALLWLLAITAAYPHFPGSRSGAFKGMSVFVGLVISLSSAGLVNQLMSGLVIVYSRTFKLGDYVQVGETEGTVSHIGVLSTKVVTRRREEIIIPNAVLVGDVVKNYSKLAGEQGSIVPVSLTIGYDVPWRKVRALLLAAAERTRGVRQDPRPKLLVRALSSFYVEYNLLVHLERPEERIPVLSDLHSEILDAFNESGVQIMAPHYESQPAEKVVAPPPSSTPLTSDPA